MLTPLLVLSPLRVIIHLVLMKHHGGDRPIGEERLGQREHAGAYHQRIGSFSCFRIMNMRAKRKCPAIDRDINDERIAHHSGSDILLSHRRFYADAIMLNLCRYLIAAFLPLREFRYPSLARAPSKRVGKLLYERQLPHFRK